MKSNGEEKKAIAAIVTDTMCGESFEAYQEHYGEGRSPQEVFESGFRAGSVATLTVVEE